MMIMMCNVMNEAHALVHAAETVGVPLTVGLDAADERNRQEEDEPHRSDVPLASIKVP
jgi:hypothetical protein